EYQQQLVRTVDERTFELRRTAEQLESALQRQKELDRQRSDFFANASHELRTPLTLILSPIEALVSSETVSQELREDLEGVLHSAYRMTKLVNDLLDLSKLEAGKMKLRVAKTDLCELLVEVVRPWRSTLDKRRITLSISLPPKLSLI